MKRCPACDRTFPDAMKFCQTDGTVLVDDATPADPYKTVIGNQSDIASATPPVDPFQTMVASPPQQAGENDLLQLPEEPDLLKTKIIPSGNLKAKSKTDEADDVPQLDLPPPATYNPSAPLIEPKPASQIDSAPAPPKFGDSFLSEPEPPRFSETGLSEANTIIDINSPKKNTSPFDSKPLPTDFSTQSPYDDREGKPIPSPFQNSMPPGYQPPSESTFDAPKPPPFQEPEPMFGEGRQEPANQSAFSPPSPFGSAEPFSAPVPQNEWTPPPAPVSEWQNQNLGANTPFQPPVAAAGQDQTLPIVSLVLGILSLCCYVSPLTGLAALVTGYLGMKNADRDPAQYGGRTMALIGMILGGLFFLIGIAYWIFVFILGASGALMPR